MADNAVFAPYVHLTPADIAAIAAASNGNPGGGSGPNPAQDGTDATGITAPSGAAGIRGWLSGIFAGIGTPTDTPWSTGSGTLVALGKAIVGKLAGVLTVTLNGMLPAGTNLIGAVNPFTAIPGATTTLSAGPTATAAPVALPANTASAYRIRNAATSASPVAWRLNTTNSTAAGSAPVTPTAYSTTGTGGTVGDKMIDPGGVEIFALTAAQQTAIAAGSLFLSAVTPTGGSATVSVTPGVAGV